MSVPRPGTRTLDTNALASTFTVGVGKTFDGFGGGALAVNCAVTDRAPSIVTVHVEVPEHPSPLQPANDEPAAGDAVNVTDDPSTKVSEQSEPQSIPAGDEVTVPTPVPDFETAKLNRAAGTGTTVNSASMARAALIVTVHVEVPEQPDPLQPVNDEPAAGDAVSVTLVERPKL